jgi:hypothetical protein
MQAQPQSSLLPARTEPTPQLAQQPRLSQLSDCLASYWLEPVLREVLAPLRRVPPPQVALWKAPQLKAGSQPEQRALPLRRNPDSPR